MSLVWRRALIVVCSVASAGAGRAETPGVPHLTGARAWQVLVGNTIAGLTPDGEYSDYFAADGTAIHADRDGSDRGRWVLREDAVCLSFPQDDAEDCRTPEVEGDRGAFVDRDGSRYPFALLRGNAKHL